LAEKSLLLPLPARPEEQAELGSLAAPPGQRVSTDWASEATRLRRRRRARSQPLACSRRCANMPGSGSRLRAS
jgi:hypothetical protein